ncbi:MAG: oligosaccharide flippase family protein [Tissierellaceae bacterium]
MSRNKFIHGSIIMILMNTFTRAIGFTYEVLLSKSLGAEAMGWFQIAMSTLMIFLVFTISGIPSSVTKLVAQEYSNGNQYNMEKIYKSSLFFNLFLGIFLSIGLLLSSKFIASRVFRNGDLLMEVYFLAPAIIIISTSNILRAYFYGRQNMVTPSISQTLEHLARFVIVLGLLSYFSPLKPLYGTIIAIMGISIGELIDLAWSLLSKKRLYYASPLTCREKWTSLEALSKVLLLALPLTILGFFNVGLNFLNAILIPSRLMSAGYTKSLAVASFGRITGMAMPLIHLPFVVTSGLVVNIVPSLSEQIALKKSSSMRADIQLAVKVTLLVSIPLSIFYVVLSEPLAIFLYDDLLVAGFIGIMGPATALLALQHTLSGILFGLNRQFQATVARMFAMLLRVYLIYILVGNPRFEIYGFFIAFFVSSILTLLFDMLILRTALPISFNYIDMVGKPILASLFAIGYLRFTVFDLEKLKYVNPASFVFSLCVALLSYIFILMLTNALPKNLLERVIKGQ